MQAIVFAVVAVSRARRHPDRGQQGLATGALVLSLVDVLGFVVLAGFVLLLAAISHLHVTF